MKRFLTSALVLGSFSVVTLVGCEDTSKTKETVSTPEGSTTTTKKIESTGGDKAPTNSAGETGKDVPK